MPKIFVSYRRDDDPNGAARIRDALIARFGRGSVFMDVDDLLAGLRFDEELAKALAECDVFLAVMGPRWIDLLRAKAASGDRDYVREEIAEALKRKIVVIPVRIGREGQLPPLPRADHLPAEICNLVHYQKHDITYERFARDAEELTAAITAVRRRLRPAPTRTAPRVPWGWVAATAVSVLAVGYVGAYYSRVPVPWPASVSDPVPVGLTPPARTDAAPDARRAAAEAKARAEEVERLRLVAAEAEKENKRLHEEAEGRRKAEEAEQRRVAALKSEEDRQRVAALRAEQERQRAALEAKSKTDDEAPIAQVPKAAPPPATIKPETVLSVPKAAPPPAATKPETSTPVLSSKPDPARTIKAGSGQSFRDTLADGSACAFCPEMVVVPAGAFTMGSSAAEIAALTRQEPYLKDWFEREAPQRRVTFQNPFAVGRFEVTLAEWDACAQDGKNCSPASNGYLTIPYPKTGAAREKQPVINISWSAAERYTEWLSAKTGLPYRLLSEAEWEYAARAGTSTRYWWGSTISNAQANYSNKQRSTVGPLPVDSFKPNPWGLYNVHGNIREWVQDTWHYPDYRDAPTDGSVWKGGAEEFRVWRGGSWIDGSSRVTAAARDYSRLSPDEYLVRATPMGLRVARPLSR